MRTIYGLLVVSGLMFVSGLTMLVLAARGSGPTSDATPSATVKQLMQGLVVPASRAIYDAVSTTVTEKGTVDVFPRNDREWEVVGSHAMALVEAANLLKVGGRARDSRDWIRMSDAMAKAAMQSYRASERKSTEALLAAGEILNNSCESCHRNYDIPVE